MTNFVVIDASLALKWILPEPETEEAFAMGDRWLNEGIRVTGPSLLIEEATNVLHRRTLTGQISRAMAKERLVALFNVGVQIEESPNIHLHALELAQDLGLAATYDAHYLALADLLGCDLWTADERFFNSVKNRKSTVKLLGAA